MQIYLTIILSISLYNSALLGMQRVLQESDLENAACSLAQLQKAISIEEKKHVEAVFSSGWQHLCQQHYDEAIEDFNRVLKQSEDPILNAKTLLNIGTIYDIAKQANKARNVWNLVIQENASPITTSFAKLYLGMLYEYGGNDIEADWLEAKKLFKEVIGQNNNSEARASALFALADMYYHSPVFYESFEVVVCYLQEAATQKDNPQVAVQAQELLKEVVNYAANQNESLVAQQQARRYGNLLHPPQQALISQSEAIPATASAIATEQKQRAEQPILENYTFAQQDDNVRAYINNEEKTLLKISTPSNALLNSHLSQAKIYIAQGRYTCALKSLEKAANSTDKAVQAGARYELGKLYSNIDHKSKHVPFDWPKAEGYLKLAAGQDAHLEIKDLAITLLDTLNKQQQSEVVAEKKRKANTDTNSNVKQKIKE